MPFRSLLTARACAWKGRPNLQTLTDSFANRETLAKAPTAPTVRSPDGGIAKRTLVVCPLCVAIQWKDEIEAKTPQLSVALYHGPNRRSLYTPSLLASHDIVVTTYDVLSHESNESPLGPIFRVPWFRCFTSLHEPQQVSHMKAAK